MATNFLEAPVTLATKASALLPPGPLAQGAVEGTPPACRVCCACVVAVPGGDLRQLLLAPLLVVVLATTGLEDAARRCRGAPGRRGVNCASGHADGRASTRAAQDSRRQVACCARARDAAAVDRPGAGQPWVPCVLLASRRRATPRRAMPASILARWRRGALGHACSGRWV